MFKSPTLFTYSQVLLRSEAGWDVRDFAKELWMDGWMGLTFKRKEEEEEEDYHYC